MLAQNTSSSNVITIEYSSGVKKPCGWRTETFTAIAERISEKRARVLEVIDITGNDSNRQRFNPGFVARLEVGKIKNLGSCWIIEGMI